MDLSDVFCNIYAIEGCFKIRLLLGGIVSIKVNTLLGYLNKNQKFGNEL